MMIVTHGRARRGAVTTALLVLFCLLLIVMLWAAELLSFRSHARVELNIADDAVTHAAARDLVTDSAFTRAYVNDGTSVVPIDRGALLAKARADGERFGRLSRVMGRPVTVNDNPDNDPAGDIFLGTLDNPTSRTFIGLDRTGFDPFNPDLNAVRLKTRLARVAASSTYFVDHDVIGFRLKEPPPTSPGFPTVPMVPLAILSEPCAPAQNTPTCWGSKDATTWEKQVMARAGKDEWSVGPSGAPVNVGDGIPEIKVTLTQGDNSNDNAQLVYFNPAETFAALVGQVKNGVAYGDLATGGQKPGQFLLNDGTQKVNQAPALTEPLPPPSSSVGPGGASVLAGSAQNQTGLLGILGQPRVWLLYSGLTSQNGTQTVNVVGFVVARVMAVQVAGGSLTVTLQPSVLVTDKAVTNWTLRDLGPRSLYNPYVARLRFVE
ncbi:MAG TPA: hypothetical protein VFW33_16635 [Gemmataceae bacterium]|nr:hypothetical protein [Gemmataceae bacterium]